MNPLATIIGNARDSPKRIVLSEGEDSRVIAAAVRAQRDRLAHLVLIGRPAVVGPKLVASGADCGAISVVDPSESPSAGDYAAQYHELRRHRGVDTEAARTAIRDPLVFAAMMVRAGDADGTVGGAVATSGDTVRAALQVIGRAPGVASVSSFFLVVLAEDHHPRHAVLAFADCALIIEPTIEELTQIAISTADSYRALLGETPRIAMLSFSTAGSADHPCVARVHAATAGVRIARPRMVIDGAIQFDAAFVPAVGKTKAPASPLRGDANVFVFPGLEAANIGYKIAHRLGGAMAIGPILQGLARPANDLSRGCSVADVYHLIAVTCVQAARSPESETALAADERVQIT